MGTTVLPVFLVTSKFNVKFIGQSSSFKETYVLVCRECKKHGIRYKREYVRCQSSGAKITIAEEVRGSFGAWFYMIPVHKPKKVLVKTKPRKSGVEKLVAKLIRKTVAVKKPVKGKKRK